jgi:ABC-2 type transport system ATP-binding protein
VDPTARRAFWDLIYTLVDEGVTALVTTHYMDEAEYCGRVGIMRQGRLLAMDTPTALKEKALPGLAWDVFSPGHETSQLLSVLQALERCPCVLRAGLVSDRVRAITPFETTADTLLQHLHGEGLAEIMVERAEPTLEDVFLALAID